MMALTLTTLLMFRTLHAQGLAADYPNLPSSVYTDLANTSLSTVNLPAGNWRLPSSAPLLITRSNLTVNFAGSKLWMHAADAPGGWYPIQVKSTSVTSPTYFPSPDGGGTATRTLTHATGTISTGTTTLTMVSGEFVNYTPGETVLIWAGVSHTDPVESEAFIPAVVSSVNMTTGVVTFTAGLGRDITNYVNSAGVQAAIADSSLHWKVGPWGNYPDPGNFSKGYGTDHGIERFTGGMVHDVTLNDISLQFDPMTVSADVPNGMWDVAAIAVQNFTVNGLTIVNPSQSGLHLWRTFNAEINDYSVSGGGLGKIYGTDTFESPAATIWGGDGAVFNGLSIVGTNMTAFNVEIGAEGIEVNDLLMDVTYTSARAYSSAPLLLGFYSIRGRVQIGDASLKAVTTGGSAHEYFAGAIDFNGELTIPWSAPTADFNWKYNNNDIGLLGTVVLNGVTYGPPVTETVDVNVLHGASQRYLDVPDLVISGTMQVLTPGELNNIEDSFGHYYSGAVGGTVTALEGDRWAQIEAGPTNLANFVAKRVIFDLNGGSSDAVVRFVWTRLPVVP